MENISKVAKAEIARLEKMIKKIDLFLADVPVGCLKWQHKKGKIYYYQQYMKTDTKKWSRKYIKKEELSLAKKLAQKHYYLLVRPIVERKLEELIKFVKRYSESEIEEVYDKISRERKQLVTPLLLSVKEQIKQWQGELYEQTSMYSENLRYETEQGEIVRSKSEVIIANILYQNRENILYKYERPLNITVEGILKTIYPDFTILNIHTGKITYWEHAGCMDDPYYASGVVRKINMYIANNLLPERDVILTFEAQENPLDIGVVKKLLKDLI